MDISSTLKTRLQGKYDLAMVQTLYQNLQLSSGILTPSSAEPATILITLLTCQPYTLWILHEIILQCTFFIFNITLAYHLHYSLVLTLIPTMNSSQTEPGELVIFQPVLQAYPTRHSWIITAHASLGNLECQWKLTRQLTRTHQFLRSLDQHPTVPIQLLATLQLELSNIQDIYKSSETTITSAIKLLNSNPQQTRAWHRRSLLPFLGEALSWLTGTATTRDIHSIKTWINQLIATQSSQHNTLVHIVSILNVIRYATQVNRQSINNLIDAVCTSSQDINNLYNLTTSLATSINFNQMILHIKSVFAYLQDYLLYLWTLSIHTMEYIDAAISGILLPHVLPIVDLQQMLRHIADTLPPTLHLPISPEDMLHFYRYLHTHVLIEHKQFLFLIDISIQDRACQITVHQVFTLDIPHGSYSAHYDINTKYFGVTKDVTMGVEISTPQF